MSLAVPPSWRPLGDMVYTDNSAARSLSGSTPNASSSLSSLPAAANAAIMSVKTQSINVHMSGGTPTSTIGVTLPAGSVVVFENARNVLTTMKWIENAASAVVAFDLFESEQG